MSCAAASWACVGCQTILKLSESNRIECKNAKGQHARRRRTADSNKPAAPASANHEAAAGEAADEATAVVDLTPRQEGFISTLLAVPR